VREKVPEGVGGLIRRVHVHATLWRGAREEKQAPAGRSTDRAALLEGGGEK
jgi:hypothetical protein